MIEHKILLPFPLSHQTLENFDNNVVFLDSRIMGYEVDQEGEYVVLQLSSEDAVDEVTEKILGLLNKLKPFRELETTVVFDNLKQEVPCSSDVFTELMASGDVMEISTGLYALQGLPMAMIKALNENVIEFANSLGAKEVLYPVLNPISDLREAAFFKRTPQHANFVSLFSEDGTKISDFCKLLDENNVSKFYDFFKQPTHICRSAICSNSYPTYKDRVFAKGETVCLTTLGRAFRNEAKAVRSLERLHEFSMREIIFYGDKDYVKVSLGKCMEWFKDVIGRLELKAVIQTAGDPFYADNVNALQFYQYAEQSKYEVRLVNPFTKNEVSCGSMNDHGHHFSKSFNICLDDGSYATSGCVGFGFERTVFLVLSQYGASPRAWPSALRTFFKL